MSYAGHQDEFVWQFFDCRREGFFVEVGANEPVDGSLTWLLEQNGWRGLLVEPQRNLYEMLQRQRPASQVVCAACTAPGKQGLVDLYIPPRHLEDFATLERNVDDFSVEYERTEKVEAVTLDELLKRAGCVKVDFVSIDTEGTELDVLRGFSLESHQPALILLEDKGRSLDKHRHLVRHGYKLVKRTQLNNWYVPRATRFEMTSFGERLSLWRKVFVGYPLRRFRQWRHVRQQVRHKSISA
ncbi:MAG TPA: FkbM family methyltransferase [Candidatus Binatia bacterium]|nr:FkbM family methyltransferase [Candidatus Binatia bacterium]